jgi:hypothetical protein
MGARAHHRRLVTKQTIRVGTPAFALAGFGGLSPPYEPLTSICTSTLLRVACE